MENHNQAQDETLADNLGGKAVNEAPDEGQLLAGKFKSKDVLLDSVSNLVEKVEGRSLKPSEVIDLSSKDDKDLENMYLGLERRFHSGSRQEDSQEEVTDDEQVEKYLSNWAAKNGFVRKQELEAEQNEKKQLEGYFSQNPSARQREALIKQLASTPEFQSKSFAEVDQYIVQSVGIQNQPEVKKNVKVGRSPVHQEDLDPSNMTDQDWQDYFSQGHGGGGLVRKS